MSSIVTKTLWRKAWRINAKEHENAKKPLENDFLDQRKRSVLINNFRQKKFPSAQKMQFGFLIPMMFDTWLQKLLIGCQSWIFFKTEKNFPTIIFPDRVVPRSSEYNDVWYLAGHWSDLQVPICKLPEKKLPRRASLRPGKSGHFWSKTRSRYRIGSAVKRIEDFAWITVF